MLGRMFTNSPALLGAEAGGCAGGVCEPGLSLLDFQVVSIKHFLLSICF